MRRQRTIVGIGEALLVERPDDEAVGGIAADVARAAVLLGHRGVAVTRIGQDEPGTWLDEQLRAAGVHLDALQRDPDLPTGRRVVRIVAGERFERLEDRSAFDNFQWDFDLEDVARRADAVVFGLLARRDGQSRSTIDRFLDHAASSVRLLDLTNRDPDALPERGVVLRAVEYANGIVADGVAIQMLSPGAAAADLPELLRRLKVRFALVIEDGRLGGCTIDGPIAAAIDLRAGAEPIAMLAVLHHMLRGRDLDDSIRRAAAVIDAAPHLTAPPVPPGLLDETA